jgi:hypothetical protein
MCLFIDFNEGIWRVLKKKSNVQDTKLIVVLYYSVECCKFNLTVEYN